MTQVHSILRADRSELARLTQPDSQQPGAIHIVLPLTLGGATSDTLYLTIFLCAQVSVFMFFGSHAHRLGHVRTESRIIRLLQRFRFLMSPAYHKVHHSGPKDIRYCVINGWANAPCDRIGLWRALERLVFVVTGAVPRCNDGEWFERLAQDPSFMRDPIPSLVTMRSHGSEQRIEPSCIEP